MSKIYRFDFTLSAEIIDDYNKIILLLKEFCKTGTFQKELSPETEYLHYQGRVSLKKKLTIAQLIKATPVSLKGIHWTPTSNNCDNNDYTMKEYTRLEGPWNIEEEVVIKTTQLLIFEKYELYPWQQQVMDSCTKYNDREINMIYDENGGIGKSIFCEYLEFNNLAEEIPPFRLMDDIFQWVYTFHSKPAYFIDLPRGMKKDKLGDFYSGIEIIKNGVCYDKRYGAKKRRFNRPVIWIFSNMLPCLTLMSKDRWNIWEVKEKTLCKYDLAQCLV
jgi:hypothetical protein